MNAELQFAQKFAEVIRDGQRAGVPASAMVNILELAKARIIHQQLAVAQQQAAQALSTTILPAGAIPNLKTRG